MKRYKTLLFDVDDTLLDFHAAQDQALDQLFTSVDIEPTVRPYYMPMRRIIKVCGKS